VSALVLAVYHQGSRLTQHNHCQLAFVRILRNMCEIYLWGATKAFYCAIELVDVSTCIAVNPHKSRHGTTSSAISLEISVPKI
jgi:hypothetical protein